MKGSKIFYVEDEPNLGRIVSDTLKSQGFDILWGTDGAKAINQFISFDPDICILDIMLPNINGYTLCEQIRNLSKEVPIIFLTAKTEVPDLVKGFEAGGTDYMRKPFSIEELIVRIKNQLELKGNRQPTEKMLEGIEIGDYIFFPAKYELHHKKRVISLSNREAEVLFNLTTNANRVTDRKSILLNVWGDDSFFNSRTLDVYIRKLRETPEKDDRIKIQT